MMHYVAVGSFLVAGCAAEAPPESAPKAAADTADTAAAPLATVASETHPTVPDGRAVDHWETTLSSSGRFDVRGVDASGATLADFAFVPGRAPFTSIAIEIAAPERGIVRIVDGQVVESTELGDATLSLVEAMATDLDDGASMSGETAIRPQGVIGCVKWTAIVLKRCGADALRCLKHIKSLSALGLCQGQAAFGCDAAEHEWWDECVD